MALPAQPTEALPHLASHIHLRHELGRGAMGTVWAADHRDLGEVAVKVLDPELVEAHPEVAERLRFEAEAVWRIESPHITKVYERGVAGGAPYIVMELLDGETLESRLDRDGALPIADCVWVLEQMAWALAAAHEHGIVHRDLKPENVFLCGRDRVPTVKLLDFGIAKRPTDGDAPLTLPGALLGTPYYMSREQLLSSSDVDHRADLWAFAVVAYELLTSAVPFNGHNIGHLIRAVFDADFERVSDLRPELLDAGCGQLVDAWFARALNPDIELRFDSVGDMIAALRAVLPQDLDEEVSGIRRLVRDNEFGRTACWHPESSTTPPDSATQLPDVSHSEPTVAQDFVEDEPTSADIPVGSTNLWYALAAASAGAAIATIVMFV